MHVIIRVVFVEYVGVQQNGMLSDATVREQ